MESNELLSQLQQSKRETQLVSLALEEQRTLKESEQQSKMAIIYHHQQEITAIQRGSFILCMQFYYC